MNNEKDQWETKRVDEIQKHLLASSELREQRISVCEQCIELTKWKRCRVCGCFMPLKVWISTEQCPQKKW